MTRTITKMNGEEKNSTLSWSFEASSLFVTNRLVNTDTTVTQKQIIQNNDQPYVASAASACPFILLVFVPVGLSTVGILGSNGLFDCTS